MKKFLFTCAIALLSCTVAMATETKKDFFVSLENDIGCEQTICTTFSSDNSLTFLVVNNSIVGWQAPVTLSMESIKSAQVVDAYTIATPIGKVSMALVCLRWPIATINIQMNEATSLHNDQSLGAGIYDSFRHSRTDYI